MKFIVAPDSLLRSLLLCYFLLLLSSAEAQNYHGEEDCPKSFHCGNLGEIHFPFTNTTRPECGIPIRGCDDPRPEKEVLLKDQRWLKIISIYQEEDYNKIIIQDDVLYEHLFFRNCSAFDHNLSVPLPSPMMSFQVIDDITLLRCDHSVRNSAPQNFLTHTNCCDYDIYLYPYRTDDTLPSSLSACSTIQLPFKKPPHDPLLEANLFAYLTAEIQIEVTLSESCHDCYYRRGGQCRLKGEPCIINEDKTKVPEHKTKNSKAIKIGLAIGCGFIIVIGLFIILLLKELRYTCSGFLNQSRNIYFDIKSSTSAECVAVNFRVPVFSYEVLEEITNNFDPSRELGNGGFGTVYYGKLQDGREVAIKRLHKRKRDNRHVKMFMNEIQILTGLRHRNLVTLFGCTSRHSRGLLLVYEYIPNGTVASHLHGDLAKHGSLPWPVRMKIAIETASALTYLHASNIIHRDVKTNNILLNNNFCAKVADFGISRLSPNDVSHVITAPQGTLGYVDPEYRESYKLTDKSDVYSFGVVLIELISSMPAVDCTRNIDEIKLANLAIKKIQTRKFTELVDPSLGYESDNKFKRMIVSVAELAFQCLQRDKELRPSMYEVLEALQKIEWGNNEPEHLEIHGAEISQRDVRTVPSTSVDWDEIGSLTNLKRFHQTL